MNASSIQTQPAYKSHAMPDGVEIREVVAKPTSFEPLGKCHLYLNGYYRFTCVDLSEALAFTARAAA